MKDEDKVKRAARRRDEFAVKKIQQDEDLREQKKMREENQSGEKWDRQQRKREWGQRRWSGGADGNARKCKKRSRKVVG